MLVRRQSNNGGNDLHTVYRPCTIEEIVGNNLVKKLLSNHILNNDLPHSLLFTGPAGCGKTTMARLLALSLNCEISDDDTPTLKPCLECRTCKSILNQSNLDYLEVNVGSDSGKDAVSNIVKDLSSSAFSSRYKVIIFDECHKLTQGAKDLLLKVMEDTYAHVFLIFCTNEPEKLISKGGKGGNPFLGRLNKFTLELVDEEEIYNVLVNICDFEGQPYNKDVVHYISEFAKGVPRDAIVALNSVITEGSWDLSVAKQILGSIILDEEDPEIIELSRYMVRGEYKKSIKAFEGVVKKYGVESIRIAVAGYVVACLKKSSTIGDGKRFSDMLNNLTTPIYQTGKPSEHTFYNILFKTVAIAKGK